MGGNEYSESSHSEVESTSSCSSGWETPFTRNDNSCCVLGDSETGPGLKGLLRARLANDDSGELGSTGTGTGEARLKPDFIPRSN